MANLELGSTSCQAGEMRWSTCWCLGRRLSLRRNRCYRCRRWPRPVVRQGPKLVRRTDTSRPRRSDWPGECCWDRQLHPEDLPGYRIAELEFLLRYKVAKRQERWWVILQQEVAG